MSKYFRTCEQGKVKMFVCVRVCECVCARVYVCVCMCACARSSERTTNTTYWPKKEEARFSNENRVLKKIVYSKESSILSKETLTPKCSTRLDSKLTVVG